MWFSLARWRDRAAAQDEVVRQVAVLRRACGELHRQLVRARQEIVELDQERRRLVRRLDELEGRPLRVDTQDPNPGDWDTTAGFTVVVDDHGRVTGIMDDGVLVPVGPTAGSGTKVARGSA